MLSPASTAFQDRKSGVIGPDVGGELRDQAAAVNEEDAVWPCPGFFSSSSFPYDRPPTPGPARARESPKSRSEGQMTVHHGRDQWQRLSARGRTATAGIRAVRCRPAGRHGRPNSSLVHAAGCCPSSGTFMLPAIYKRRRATGFAMRRVCSPHDADRRVPRRAATEEGWPVRTSSGIDDGRAGAPL